MKGGFKNSYDKSKKGGEFPEKFGFLSQIQKTKKSDQAGKNFLLLLRGIRQRERRRMQKRHRRRSGGQTGGFVAAAARNRRAGTAASKRTASGRYSGIYHHDLKADGEKRSGGVASFSS